MNEALIEELKRAYCDGLIGVPELENELWFVLNGGSYAGSFRRVMANRTEPSQHALRVSEKSRLVEGADYFPVIDERGTIIGYITKGGDGHGSSTGTAE